MKKPKTTKKQLHPTDASKGKTLHIRLTAAEKEAWTLAAKADGRDLSGWLRHIANRAADGPVLVVPPFIRAMVEKRGRR